MTKFLEINLLRKVLIIDEESYKMLRKDRNIRPKNGDLICLHEKI